MDYEIEFPKRYIKPKLPMGKQWVEALRSGRYKQGVNKLCGTVNPISNDGKPKDPEFCYCCLGVLSKIQNRLVEKDGEYKDTINSMTVAYLITDNPLYTSLGMDGQLPYGVTVAYGGGRLFQKNLANLNDTGFSFEEIADIIEQIWDCQ